MCGRNEQERKQKETIDRLLEGKDDVFYEYIDSKRLDNLSATQMSYLRYIIEFDEYLKSKNIKTLEFRAVDIDRFLTYLKEEKNNSISSINLKLSAIKSWCSFLYDNEYIEKDPARNKKKLKEKRTEEVDVDDRIVYLTDDEVRQMRENVKTKQRHPERDYCILQLGLSTGLRVSAIRNIDVDDINFEDEYVRVVEKGNKVRRMPLNQKTVDALHEWLKVREKIASPDDHALFISQKGGRISVRAIEQMIKAEGSFTGKHITPHKMRSTFGTMILNQTGSMSLAAEALGHSSEQITRKHYAEVTGDTMRNLVNMIE